MIYFIFDENFRDRTRFISLWIASSRFTYICYSISITFFPTVNLFDQNHFYWVTMCSALGVRVISKHNNDFPLGNTLLSHKFLHSLLHLSFNRIFQPLKGTQNTVFNKWIWTFYIRWFTGTCLVQYNRCVGPNRVTTENTLTIQASTSLNAISKDFLAESQYLSSKNFISF